METKGNTPDTAQMNAKVREMIKDALESNRVEEIFKLGNEAETEQDLSVAHIRQPYLVYLIVLV
jgi:hypothetical protein